MWIWLIDEGLRRFFFVVPVDSMRNSLTRNEIRVDARLAVYVSWLQYANVGQGRGNQMARRNIFPMSAVTVLCAVATYETIGYKLAVWLKEIGQLRSCSVLSSRAVGVS
jgi:hypothetical protein